MKQFTLLGVSALFLLFTTPARADDNPFYLEAGFGHASVSRGALTPSQTQSSGMDGTTTSKTLLAGYSINQNLAFELGYHDFGDPTAFFSNPIGIPCHTVGQPCNDTCPDAANQFSCPHITGLSGALAGRYAWNQQLTLEAFAGLLRWRGGDPTMALINEDSGSVLLLGLRASYMWNDSLGFDITYEHSQFTTEETSIALRYCF